MWRAFHDAFRDLLSGERAVAQACEQNRIERFFTFPNFERSAERCGEEMRRAGLADVEVESFPADNRVAWSGWESMRAWDVTSARLWLVSPRRELLADWAVKPQHLIMYSGPTDTEGEIVEWNGEPDADLTGKIPLTHRRVNDVYARMRGLGVKGILSDFIGTLPGVRDRYDLPDDVRWENSALRPAAGGCWGFQITPRTGEMLRTLMRQGPARVRAEIVSRVYDGVFKSATGVISGAEKPEEEILFVTHLYEPGANDNASGTGLGLEIARALNEGIRAGRIARPRRSIRFLFNWEGYGLYAWMHAHEDRRRNILGGLNIDEIGVDQCKGRSVLHLFRPPAANPSCVGHLIERLCEEILTPSLRWKAVADRAEIINDTITSDPNMDVVLPCLIQYPSRCYHSSADTTDMLSADVMKTMGLVTATHLYFLANAGEAEARYLAALVADGARRDLARVERRLLAGRWPFGRERTERWFAEQFTLSVRSLRRFGLPAEKAKVLLDEISFGLAEWAGKRRSRFPEEAPRSAAPAVLDRARSLVLARVTLGSPKAWGSFRLPPEEEQRYRDILYANNLDMLFHRICYWADGRRSVLDIIERLEIELDELLRDASIARTSSGTLIEGAAKAELDVEAVMYVVERIVKAGYLSEAPPSRP